MPLLLFRRRPPLADSRALQRRPPFVPAPHTRLSTDPLDAALQAGQLGRLLAEPSPWSGHPRCAAARDQAAALVDQRFALVPEGSVSIPVTLSDEPGQPEVDCATAPFLLARYTVTNAEYQYFLDAGSYGNLELWPEEMWPDLVGFQDQTGQPGPRFWRHGRHDRRLAQHPVVGLSCYEAAAYAAWAGYRLPSEAEWQMAASWQIRSAANSARRYPWGDSLDLHRCNIRASGYGGTLPVDAYAAGAAPNGVQQLIGNVWEWTRSDFLCADRDGRTVVGDTRMNSIRGGAFDTYFAWQATASFRSGLAGLARHDNVGFRCALDLQTDPSPPPAAEGDDRVDRNATGNG
jgi:gamma-glutamyl hercynylcysteine S-oxide synthase